ncbi:MAG TPA: TerB family tellurite resistance protein, partial [Gemmatimonadales bacterium]
EEERRTRFAAYADRLRQRFGRAQRLELVERMWSVAFREGAIGAQEARLMTVAAELLGLGPAEVAEVRRRLRDADAR